MTLRYQIKIIEKEYIRLSKVISPQTPIIKKWLKDYAEGKPIYVYKDKYHKHTNFEISLNKNKLCFEEPKSLLSISRTFFGFITSEN